MLGGNVFGWAIDEKTSFGILDAFVDAGYNAVDTSDSYARWVPGNPGGESETIIGNWLKRSGKRNKVLIATKVGEDMGEGRSLKKDYILRECEASLRRLQIDCIDLYQTHFDDEVTPPEETMPDSSGVTLTVCTPAENCVAFGPSSRSGGRGPLAAGRSWSTCEFLFRSRVNPRSADERSDLPPCEARSPRTLG